MTHAAEPIISLADVRKAYPGVIALEGVSFSIHAGEVIGLVGENGAGKSTLMKILGGVVQPDGGTVRIDGQDRTGLTVNESMEAGIAFVHQELNLFENLSAAANVLIGREPLRYGPLRFVDNRRMEAIVTPLLERLGVDFTAGTLVGALSIAQRQLLEIAKALSLDARVVIMDEPTSSLTISETERLLRIVSELKADGIAVIFISHRLHEVEECADRVVVLRDGRLAGVLENHRITHDRMINMMIGRDLKSLYIPPANPPAEPALEISGAATAAFPTRRVNLAVRRGEILGLAGLMGSGRTELARAVFGIDPLLAGTVALNGEPVPTGSTRAVVERGLYLVPEDRKQAGIFLDMPVLENISLPDLASHARNFMVSRASEEAAGAAQKRSLNIKVATLMTEAGTLSGGNQQKVVLAKWLAMRPKAIIFDEPTRGIDVGAKNEIYALMRQLADAGVAVLMISSDMEEVIGVSDRVAVMHEGEIAGILEREAMSEQSILSLAVGHQAQAEQVAC